VRPEHESSRMQKEAEDCTQIRVL